MSVPPELVAALEALPMAELARRTGIGYSTLWAYHAGRRTPSRAALEAIADALDQAAGELHGTEQGLRKLITRIGGTDGT